MQKQAPTTSLCISNNVLLASYPSADAIHNRIIGSIIKRYSDVLSFDTDDLFGGKVETAPVTIDAKEYGISKIRLMEKCEELMKSILVRFPYRIPGGECRNVTAPLVGKAVDIAGTSRINLYINETIVPELRYIGRDMAGKQIGMTRLPGDTDILNKPYSVRIWEFLNYFEQHTKIYQGWFPPIAINGEDGKPWAGFMGKLGIPASYRKQNKLRSRILEPALKEIYEKTGREYTVQFADAGGMECTGLMKAAYLRFRLIYVKDKGSILPRLDYIFKYMRAEEFEEEAIQKTMYILRDPAVMDQVYEDLYGMQQNPSMNKHKRKACFTATLRNIGLDGR